MSVYVNLNNHKPQKSERGKKASYLGFFYTLVLHEIITYELLSHTKVVNELTYPCDDN